MSNQKQYSAITGGGTISIANSNLDGSGTMTELLTATLKGSIIKTIFVKALSNVSQGMIRFFIKRGEINFLIYEFPVNITTRSSRDLSFSGVLPFYYELQSGDILYASTEKAESFSILVEGLSWDYGTTTEDPLTSYTANTGVNIIQTANPNLDGTGTTVLIYSASSASGMMGSEITSIIIKATEKISPGIVRLFVDNGKQKLLFCEVLIPYSTPNAFNESFTHTVLAQGSLALKAGYSIYASTENSEKFNVLIEGSDWSYPA